MPHNPEHWNHTIDPVKTALKVDLERKKLHRFAMDNTNPTDNLDYDGSHIFPGITQIHQ